MQTPSSIRWSWILWFAPGIAAGCGGSDLECGPSTVEVDGKCVPRIESCAPGTIASGSQCVPACDATSRWDGEQCVPNTECAPGTQLQNGTCVPKCTEGRYWDGTACVHVPDCDPGTVFDAASGECVPSEEVCAPGSSWVNGQCVPDLECAPGTHAENGACVPDGLPTPDVPESADPEGTAEFDLPSSGNTIILGGVVDEPAAISHPDWDSYSFDADAGTYLQIEAYSAGALKPAFLVQSVAANPDGTPKYVRYAVESDGLRARRELFLPFSGAYELRVTDRDHLLASVFTSTQAIAVGGDEFGYGVEVQNLGSPTPKPVDSFPATETGDLSDGTLHFFSFPGLAAGNFVGATSLGVPPPLTESDVFTAVMATDGTTSHESVAFQTDADAEVLVAAGTTGDPMVIQDHLLTIGDREDFALELFAVEPVDCTTGGCDTGDIAANEHVVLQWNLSEGDFLTVGAYMASGNELLKASMLDGNLDFATEDTWVSPYDVGVGHLYASEATTAHLWLREVQGTPVAQYTIDARVIATPLFVDGQDQSDLPVHEMPPYTLRDAGIGHIEAQPGQMVFFSGFATHPDGAWAAPQEFLMTPRLEPMGPVIDTDAWNFPDGFVTPLFAYIKEEGHYLHYVFDGSSDFAGGTYDTRLTVLPTFALGEASQALPLVADNHNLSKGMALYTFEGKRNQYVEISVTPTLVSDMIPDLWVFNFGRAEFVYVSYRWIGDAASPRLGLVHRETGAASEAISAGYQSPYDGKTVLLVQTSTGSGSSTDRFSLRVEVPAPPGNDTCATAGPLALDANGEASFSWNMAAATNTVTYSGCNDYPSDGPDTFFRVDLSEGDTIEVEMASEEFSEALYLFTDCANVKASCKAGAESGDPRRLVYTVPAGLGGTYFIGADSHQHAGWFDMNVKVTGN